MQTQNFDFSTYDKTFWEALITGGIIQAGGSMDKSVATPCAMNVFDLPMESISLRHWSFVFDFPTLHKSCCPPTAPQLVPPDIFKMGTLGLLGAS